MAFPQTESNVTIKYENEKVVLLLHKNCLLVMVSIFLFFKHSKQVQWMTLTSSNQYHDDIKIRLSTVSTHPIYINTHYYKRVFRFPKNSSFINGCVVSHRKYLINCQKTWSRVQWILASHRSRLIMWPVYWPLIGPAVKEQSSVDWWSKLRSLGNEEMVGIRGQWQFSLNIPHLETKQSSSHIDIKISFNEFVSSKKWLFAINIKSS